MTLSEIKIWINTNIIKKVSALKAREGFLMLADNFAHKDNPLAPFTITIANGDLDGNLSIMLNHNLDSRILDYILYDEQDIQMSSESMTLQVLNYNSVKLTFFEAIPATGNGYFTLSLWKIVREILPGYAIIFESEMDDATGLNMVVTDENATYNFNAGVLEIYNGGSGIANVTGIITSCYPTPGKKYRVTVNLTLGNLKFFDNTNNYVALPVPGVHQFDFNAVSSYFRFKSLSGNYTSIDSLKIEELL